MDTLTKTERETKDNEKITKGKKEISILLIEDNPADARLIEEKLKESEHFQFSITCAGSMKKAMSIIKSQGAEFFEIFDAVLLDLGLPDCVGTKTFKKIKAELTGVPIIITTGSVLERNDLRYCLEGSHGFFIKGYTDSPTLENAILSAIDKQKEHERIICLINHKEK